MMKISILADELGAGAGGGRFTTGFLRAMLSDREVLAEIDELLIVITESQPTDGLGPLPPQARVVRRRFPSRLRQTVLAGWMGRLLPDAAVAHGTFFYVFPHQGRRDAITLHDASFLDESYHPSEHIREMTRSIENQVARCAAIACDSQAILSEVRERWPGAARKCRTIYPGAGWFAGPSRPRRDGAPGPEYILAVGTIEPRKNYALMLDAYETLRSELGERTPSLVIVGQPGWMSESVCGRLAAMAARGSVRWVKDAADPELAGWYENASVFTYLSLYEGFGYPPFEAALAGVPMVLSAASSIGEIWSGHARCVRPTDVPGIADAWKWAIGLGPAERRAVVERQRARAAEFSWKRCVTEYLGLYRELAAAPPG